MLLVEDGDIEQAIVQLLEIEKTVVEGAGAAGLAAVLKAQVARMLGQHLQEAFGQTVLIEAMAKLNRKDVYCVSLGDDQGRTEYRAELENKIETDILIVAHNSIYSVNDLLKKYKFKQLSFDSSNSNYKVKKWLKESSNKHLNAFSTNENGAFVINVE